MMTIPGVATQELQRASSDPLGWAIRSTRTAGFGLLIAGFAMGATSWYLQAAATTAQNNELAVVANVRTIFSNIQAPSVTLAPSGTAPILGPNPLQDVQNFANDTWQDVQALGSDVAQVGGALGTLGEDVAMAVIDIAKSVLAFVVHFPDILWNGLVWGIGGAVASVFMWLFPYLIVVGALLVAVSLLLDGVRWSWGVFIEPGVEMASDQLEERVRARWSRLLVRKAPPTLEASTKPEITIPPTPPEPVPAPSEPVSNAETVPETPLEQKEAPGATEESKEVSQEVLKVETKPEEAPATPEPVPTGSTEETEAILGGVPPPGWTQEQFEAYMRAAPKAEKPRGRDIALIASQLLSSSEPAAA